MKRSWAAMTAVVAVTSLAGLVRVRADESPIYAWADDKGAMHATDRLADVPEPYYSMYAAKKKELEERQKRSGQVPSAAPEPEAPPPPRPSYKAPVLIPTAAEEAARRQAWRDTMRSWRLELANATADLQANEQKVAEIRMNPILRETVQVKNQLEALEPQMAAARQRVIEARNMLLVILPKRAHDEHVPPLWLM